MYTFYRWHSHTVDVSYITYYKDKFRPEYIIYKHWIHTVQPFYFLTVEGLFENNQNTVIEQ
jgi:hypothetical protein